MLHQAGLHQAGLHQNGLTAFRMEAALVSGRAAIGRRLMAGLLPLMLLACVWAQDGASGTAAPLTALRQGTLIVWFVVAPVQTPQTGLEAVAALHNATPLDYQESTTGNLGQSASSYGQDAGSYGVDADSRSISTPTIAPGQNATTATPNGMGYRQQAASSFGQNASSYGTASSNTGQPSSTLGQNAGGYGQSAGSYGTAASNLGTASSNFGAGNSAPAQSSASAPVQPSVSSPAAEQERSRLKEAFPDLQMKFVVVDADQLKQRLTAARDTTDSPDVLLGTLPAAWWNGMDSEFGLAMLRPAVFYPNGVTDSAPGVEEIAILAHAQHMQVARALALWMSEPESGCPGCVQAGLAGKDMAAAAIAKGAVERLVNGQPLGEQSDPELAPEASEGVRRMLATMGNTSASGDGVRVQVEDASVNGSLAAVALRVVVSSAGVFGVAHPLVVLRAGKDGKWKVLQMSLNLPQAEQTSEREALMVTTPPSTAELRTGVKGVSQAAPQDGQTLTQMPELVWDNPGGAGLQVVEWQRGEGGSWSDARLYLVQDTNARLQTHVQAEFADKNGRYRWGVWSVGAEGDVKISPWRTFRLAP